MMAYLTSGTMQIVIELGCITDHRLARTSPRNRRWVVHLQVPAFTADFPACAAPKNRQPRINRVFSSFNSPPVGKYRLSCLLQSRPTLTKPSLGAAAPSLIHQLNIRCCRSLSAHKAAPYGPTRSIYRPQSATHHFIFRLIRRGRLPAVHLPAPDPTGPDHRG